MKKTMFYLAALLCCMTMLTACGSDNDEPQQAPTATGTYTITFGTDFFNAAKHVNIYYKGDNGELKNDVVTSGTTWTKKVTSTKFPAELAFKVVIEPREPEELTLDSYNVSMSGAIAGAVSTGGSFNNSSSFISLGTTSKDKVLDLLKRHKESYYGYKLGKDGNATQYTPSF